MNKFLLMLATAVASNDKLRSSVVTFAKDVKKVVDESKKEKADEDSSNDIQPSRPEDC